MCLAHHFMLIGHDTAEACQATHGEPEAPVAPTRGLTDPAPRPHPDDTLPAAAEPAAVLHPRRRTKDLHTAAF